MLYYRKRWLIFKSQTKENIDLFSKIFSWITDRNALIVYGGSLVQNVYSNDVFGSHGSDPGVYSFIYYYRVNVV